MKRLLLSALLVLSAATLTAQPAGRGIYYLQIIRAESVNVAGVPILTRLLSVGDSTFRALDSITQLRAGLDTNTSRLARVADSTRRALDSIAQLRNTANALGGTVLALQDSLRRAWDSLATLRGLTSSQASRLLALTDSLGDAYDSLLAIRSTANLALSLGLTVQDSLRRSYDSIIVLSARSLSAITRLRQVSDSLSAVFDSVAAHRSDINGKVAQGDSNLVFATPTYVSPAPIPLVDTLDFGSRWLVRYDTLTADITYYLSGYSPIYTEAPRRVVITNPGGYRVTWEPKTAIAWANDETPTQSPSATDIWTFEVLNGMVLAYKWGTFRAPLVIVVDTTAPDSSMDLRAVSASTNSITYRWNRPASGNEGFENITYDFRMEANKHVGYSAASGGAGIAKVSKQSGTWTLPAGSSTATVTLGTPVTLAKSLLFYSYADTGKQLNYSQVAAGLTGTQEITFRRHTGAGSHSITGEYAVLEFSSGLTAEHGTLTFHSDSTVENVTVTASNTDSSFILFSNTNSSTTTSNGHALIRAELTASTNARFTREAAAGSSNIVYYTVGKLDSSVVYKDTVLLASGVASRTKNITSTALGKGWLITSGNVGNVTATDVGRGFGTGEHTNATTLTFWRDHHGSTALTMHYFLVKFTGATDSVYNDSLSFADVTLARSQGSIPLDASVSVPWANGHWGIGGTTALTTGGNFNAAKFNLNYSGGTLTATRGITRSAVASVPHQILKFGNVTSGGRDTVAFASATRANGVLTQTDNQTMAYTVSGLTPGTFYSFRFTATDDSGNVSGLSAAADTTTPAMVIPVVGDYYVDSASGNDANAGTLVAPFKTIGAAAAKAGAGDTVLIRTGTYNETVRPNSGNPTEGHVVFMAYTGERVVITKPGGTAIDLTDRSYITFDSVKVHNVSRWVLGSNAHYIHFTDCDFYNRTAYSGVSVENGSSYWRILNSAFDGGPGDSAGTSVGGDLISFWTGSTTHHNVIKGNTFTRFAHGAISVRQSRYNVVRDNTIHRGHTAVGTSGTQYQRNLIEGNTIYDYSRMKGWGHGMQMGGVSNIYLRNTIYGDTVDTKATGNFDYQYVSLGAYNISGDNTDVINNRVGHNTLVANDTITLPSWKDGIRVTSYTSDPIRVNTGNQIKNNIIAFANRHAISEGHYVTRANISTVWNGNLVIPDTVGEYTVRMQGSDGTSRYTTAGATAIGSRYGAGNFESSITGVFTDYAGNDFTLATGSPAIDKGVNLTTAVGAGTNATVLTVADASWFSDGYGIDDPHTIRIGSGAAVRIQSVNDALNQIVIAEPRTWSNGDGVNLDYNGTAPDVGADEY